ncbi:hypothetical protein [Thalassoroseus pseudoceratinae]|uniref:hypothetical protein n=1 Tax=Thalassoroseus pseudoceratinae TaxID=2713176 RepID=UPI0014205AAD|nr:hypothetical protein [Thalassoroseus pseudoceratinae]
MLFEPLPDARDRIEQDGPQTIDAVLHEWKTILKQIGRRRGKALEKQVLDILSYECRTALHRCYSAVWDALLPYLGWQYDLTDKCKAFHQLWHYDHCTPSNEYERINFHLFHGHIFALHPACGPVLRTQTGQELFGEWLQEGTLSSYHRVLHALAVAVGFYAEQSNIAKLLRKNEQRENYYGDLVPLEKRLQSRRSGRR